MIKRMFGDPVEDLVGGSASEDEAEEIISFSEHDSASEIEGVDEQFTDTDETASDGVLASNPIMKGKDQQTIWNKHLIVKKYSKTPAKNVVKVIPKVLTDKLLVKDEMSAFLQLFTSDMLDHITECTNIFITSIQVGFQRDTYAKITIKDELLAYIGLLFLSGVMKGNHTNLSDLWETDGTGIEEFRACMNIKRSLFLLRVIRLNDKTDRPQRQTFDKLAAVTTIVNKFVENCKKNYCVGELFTKC